MHDLQRQGAWLFRYRSYLPFLTLVLFSVQFSTYSYPLGSHTADVLLEVLCFAIALTGLGIRIHVVGHAPRGTSGRTTTHPRASVLNTTGMYSIVRNPLYLGNMLIWAAVTIFFHSAVFSCACLCLFVLYYERIILSEEAFLRERFGASYEQWERQTPMLIPCIRNWAAPVLPFCWKTALKREYTGLFVITTAFAVLEVVGDVRQRGALHVERPWMAIFCGGAAAYIAIRMLKKAGYLAVEGR